MPVLNVRGSKYVAAEPGDTVAPDAESNKGMGDVAQGAETPLIEDSESLSKGPAPSAPPIENNNPRGRRRRTIACRVRSAHG